MLGKVWYSGGAPGPKINSHETNSHEIILTNQLLTRSIPIWSIHSSFFSSNIETITYSLKTVYSPVWRLKESRYSSMLVRVSAIFTSLFYSPWRLFCARLVQTNFHPCGCLLFLNHFDKLKDVGVWLSHCFLQARKPNFNMCVGCQSRNSSIVGTGIAY